MKKINHKQREIIKFFQNQLSFGEELVKEKCTMDWLTYNIEIALKATNKLAYPDKYDN